MTSPRPPHTAPLRPSLSGIYRYVRHSDLLQFLALGWTPVADLGPTHGEWSSLMWFCCGDCHDYEPPTPQCAVLRAQT